MVALSPPSPDSLPSTQEHALLASLIAPPNPAYPTDPLSLSQRFSISLPILLDWLSAPETRTRIAAAADAQQLFLQNRSHRAKLRALDALERILDTNPDPVEQRRAATAILRPLGPGYRHAPRSAPSPSSASDADETPETPVVLEPISHPKPNRAPHDTVLLLLSRLQDTHNPTDNCGLASLYAHMTDSARKERAEYRDYLDNPGDDDKLTNFCTALLHAPTLINLNPAAKHDPAAHFTQPLTLTFKDLSTHNATLHLKQFTARDTTEPLWLITHIDHDPIRAEQRELPADCNNPAPQPQSQAPTPAPTVFPSATTSPDPDDLPPDLSHIDAELDEDLDLEDELELPPSFPPERSQGEGSPSFPTSPLPSSTSCPPSSSSPPNNIPPSTPTAPPPNSS